MSSSDRQEWFCFQLLPIVEIKRDFRDEGIWHSRSSVHFSKATGGLAGQGSTRRGSRLQGGDGGNGKTPQTLDLAQEISLKLVEGRALDVCGMRFGF